MAHYLFVMRLETKLIFVGNTRVRITRVIPAYYPRGTLPVPGNFAPNGLLAKLFSIRWLL